MIVRTNKTSDYTVMGNYHLKDKRMTLKSKGLLSMVLSLPDNWNYNVNGLVSLCKEGETTITSCLKELKELGYLKITKIMPNESENGRIEYVYNFFEKSFENTEYENEKEQEGEKQGVEILGLENLGLYKYTKKENTKNNIDTRAYAKKKDNDFIPPTLEEVKEYCLKRNNNVNAKTFYDYYNEVNWLDSKGKPVRAWKQKMIAVWEKDNKTSYNQPKQPLKELNIKDNDNELLKLFEDLTL